tara:strand:+ start:106 stop:876 length:771 start_codon:yes stop_codon:yes gene_type:complete
MFNLIKIKNMKEKIALIDGDSLLYFEMGKPTLEDAIDSLDHRLHEMIDRCGADKYAGFLTIGKCFRYEKAKTREYKGNRKHGNKPIIFYALKEYLKQEWKFEYIPELEADDLVAVYSTENTMICSPDKDVLYQVPGTHYNYRTADFIETTPTEAKIFLWKQMLMGDPTDGIPGIPKVGLKTAESWLKKVLPPDMPAFVLEKYIEKFGNAEGICKFAETFRLVYILKSKEDVLRETGIELKDLVINDVKPLNENEWL